MKVCYIGTAVSDSDFARLGNVNAAGNLAERGIIEALHTSGVGLDGVISFWPMSPFPRSKTIFVRGKMEYVVDGVRARFFPCVNIFPIRNFIRYLFLTVWLVYWKIRNVGESCVVVTYNMVMPNAIYLRIITRVLRIKLCPVVFDWLPPDGVGRPLVKKILEPLWFRKMTYNMLSRMDGAMVISQNIAKEKSGGVRCLLLDGGVTDKVVKRLFPLRVSKTRLFKILFAGSINKIEHIDIMLAFMAENKDENIRMIFAGQLEVPEVLVAAYEDPRIEYRGKLSLDDLFECYKEADMFVCLRDTEDPMLRYHYPAKTLELLTVGKPYVTTNTNHTKEVYGEYCEVLDACTLKCFASAVCRIRAMSQDERVVYGKKARDFMLRNRTWRAQGVRMRKYLEGLF